MPNIKKLILLTVDEYLENEQTSHVRHEFIDGQIFAMVGTSKRHNLIAGSLYATIRAHLKPPCQIYFADVKVRIENVFYYPDLLVSCTDNPESRYYETKPSLIIEVLSLSTEAKNRFEKRFNVSTPA